jgi:hypothetical protein
MAKTERTFTANRELRIRAAELRRQAAETIKVSHQLMNNAALIKQDSKELLLRPRKRQRAG